MIKFEKICIKEKIQIYIKNFQINSENSNQNPTNNNKNLFIAFKKNYNCTNLGLQLVYD